MTLYIEQIPRKDDSPYWTTDLTLDDINEIRDWITKNCDTTKRHVISTSLRGPVLVEGIQITKFYGSCDNKKPTRAIFDCNKKQHNGYLLFDSEKDAMAHYYASKKEANEILDQQEKIVKETLHNLSTQGITLGAWASSADDYRLEYGLCVECTINNFCFMRKIEYN